MYFWLSTQGCIKQALDFSLIRDMRKKGMGSLMSDNIHGYYDSKFWIKHKDVLKKIDSLPDCLTLKSKENELWLYDEKSFQKFVELILSANIGDNNA